MTLATTRTVGVQVTDGVATVELGRPEVLNAFDVQLGRELWAVLDEISRDRAIGAVVLTGAGRAFSAGFDLNGGGVPLLESGLPDTAWALREVFNPITLILREMPQPVVAAVNGVAAGIGCSYALACDLVVAGRSASLLLAFVNVGLVPDGGASVLVPARAGLGRALEMSLLGHRIAAQTAMDWGLVNRVEDDADVLAAATELATRLAGGPPEAQAAIKAVLNAPIMPLLRAQLALEAGTQAERSGSGEAAEAVAAFLDKRPAVFRGG